MTGHSFKQAVVTMEPGGLTAVRECIAKSLMSKGRKVLALVRSMVLANYMRQSLLCMSV